MCLLRGRNIILRMYLHTVASIHALKVLMSFSKYKSQTLTEVSRLLFIYQRRIICGWFNVKVVNTNRFDIRDNCQTIGVHNVLEKI